jgi:hypothetical protein
MQSKNLFTHLKLNNFLEWTTSFFFLISFFFIKCAQNGKDVIKSAKGIEIIEISFL